MLLELLKHHEGLFMAAMGPLIGARKCRDLAALGATCVQINNFIGAKISLMHYHKKFINILEELNKIQTFQYNIAIAGSSYSRNIINICNKKIFIYLRLTYNMKKYKHDGVDILLITVIEQHTCSGIRVEHGLREYKRYIYCTSNKCKLGSDNYPRWLYDCEEYLALKINRL